MSLEKKDLRRDLIEKALGNVDYSIEEIRKLSRSLVAPSLGDIGLAEALQELAEDINETGKFQVKFANRLSQHYKIDKNMELMLYRIAQEQLNNIRKYAKASAVEISLWEDNTNLFFSIKDDGVGFDPEVKAKGIGLKNIASRVDFYSGTMKIVSSPGNGCSIDITIPLV